MTININYNNYTLFDIEFYCAKNDTKNTDEAWYSELNVCTCVRGISNFLKDNINKEDFNLCTFINDSEVIEELRGWLWEKHSNKLCTIGACEERHYHIFKPELDNIINQYCHKYNLTANVD